MMQKWIAVVLITAMAAGLCACGQGQEEEQEQQAMGRFMEEELELPDGIDRVLGMEQLDNGELLLLGESTETGERCLERSADGGDTWEQETLPKEIGPETLNYIMEADISGTGEILVNTYDENMSSVLYYADSAGKVQEIRPGLSDGGQENAGEESGEQSENTAAMATEGIQYARLGENGHIYVQDYQGNVMELDPQTGAVLQTLVGNGGSYFFEIQAGILLTLEQDGLHKYETETGQPVEVDEVLNDSLGKQAAEDYINGGLNQTVAVGIGEEEGSSIYLTVQGLYSYQSGGSTVEQLINGELNSLSAPHLSYQGVWQRDGQYLALVLDESNVKNVLYRYTYSADVPTVPDKELKIFTLEDSGELRQAVSQYRKQNPNVYVNLEVALSGEDGVTAEDAIRSQNTSQLAGTGADILILDGFPVESYMEKGMLMDISDIADEIHETDGIFENIRAAYETDGALYALPAWFFLPVVLGEQEGVEAAAGLETLGNYAETAEQTQDGQKLFPEMSAENILEELYHGVSGDWLENGQLSEEQVKIYLQAAKQIYDADQETAGSDENSANFYSNASAQSAITGTISQYCISCYSGSARMSFGLMGSVMDYMTMQAVCRGTGMQWSSFGDGDSFVPYLLAGISSKTQMEQEAKDFLKILWGSEIGASMASGIPINRSLLETMEENVQNGELTGGVSIFNADGSMSVLELEPPTEEELQQFRQAAEKAGQAELDSRVIKELVMEQGSNYVTGSAALEEAVSAILQKANLYFSE